jgi:hypothetical protein
MLSDKHFYHRTTRKIVVAFGNMFNNLKLYRYDSTGTTEIERITVPLSYAGKEKFYTRITQDPNLAKAVETTLPRMSFELTSIVYDPLRKITAYNKPFEVQDSNTAKTTLVTPYNFEFNLYVHVRNTEDGTQIVEQILPFFSPDYTMTLDLINFDSAKVDVPIILNSINYEVQDDTGLPESVRMITWTLNFVAKGFIYGPIENPKIIRKSIARIYYDGNLGTSRRELILNNGSGQFKVGEKIYQGSTIYKANATGYVERWANTSNTLLISDATGSFTTNNKIHGASTGTTYNIQRIISDKQELAHIEVTPNPPTANVEDDYGFTTIITEYPNIV